MNIAMEDTTEHVDGVLKTTYGDAFIRGNNGMFLFLFVFFLHLQYNKHRWPMLVLYITELDI